MRGSKLDVERWTFLPRRRSAFRRNYQDSARPLREAKCSTPNAKMGHDPASLSDQFSPFGIHFSNFATSAFAEGLTGMPHQSKKSPRFFFVIFE